MAKAEVGDEVLGLQSIQHLSQQKVAAVLLAIPVAIKELDLHARVIQMHPAIRIPTLEFAQVQGVDPRIILPDRRTPVLGVRHRF
ncbi:MAG: hypothetical protein GWO24_12195, partial [Akkermansiaceae bacterium]|nr:hypothetical protein [Akkermansiaceae bacterium]